jgi:3D (Asp-Asp-Asp) domain-containing protein
MVRRIASAFALLIALLVATPSFGAPDPHSNRYARTVRMMATAYCDRGATKSGVRAQPGVVAADVRRLPLGTKLRVIAPGQPYAGTYTVLDTGSKIRGRDLDIFMASCSRARRFGKRPVQVRVLTDHDDR